MFISKKSLVLLISLMLIITITGCGGGGGSNEDDTYSITGAVTSADGVSGIEGVLITFGNGGTVKTDQNGEFKKSGLTAPDTLTVEHRTGWTFDTNTLDIDENNRNPIFHLTGFNEEFDYNDNDWDEINELEVNSGITKGYYQFNFSEELYSALVLAPLGLSTEYTLETSVRSTSREGEYGFAFNLTSWDQYHHVLIIDPDAKTYEITRRYKLSGQKPNFVSVTGLKNCSAINTNGWNKITLAVSGNRITLLKINDSADLITTDIKIPNSEIYADHWAALYAGTWTGEDLVTIQFDKFSFSANVTAGSSLIMRNMSYSKKMNLKKSSTGSSFRKRK